MSVVLLSTLSLCPGSFSPESLQLDHDSMFPALRNLPSLPDGIRYLPRHHTVSPRVSFAVVFGYSSTQKSWIRQRRPCPCSVPFCCSQFPRVKAGLCSSVCTPAVLPLLLTPSPVYTPAAQSALSSQEHAYMVLPFRWLYSLGIGASPARS